MANVGEMNGKVDHIDEETLQQQISKAIEYMKEPDINTGQPVPISAAYHSCSYFYVDYGLPSFKLFTTAQAPFVFLGVDFTRQFSANLFPQPPTQNRAHAIRMWIHACKKLAKEQGQRFPPHLLDLQAHLDDSRRGLKYTKADRFREHFEQHAIPPELHPRDQLRGSPFVTLPPEFALRTNRRRMILYLFDAPLRDQAPRHYTEEQTLQIFNEYHWHARSVITSALELTRVVPPLRVWNPSIAPPTYVAPPQLIAPPQAIAPSASTPPTQYQLAATTTSLSSPQAQELNPSTSAQGMEVEEGTDSDLPASGREQSLQVLPPSPLELSPSPSNVEVEALLHAAGPNQLRGTNMELDESQSELLGSRDGVPPHRADVQAPISLYSFC
ncbi:hypothetical protein OC846_006725 [Tilletia horrida]|uniref:Uncharacterized protein n=1 Tax=Tilletia horrida TaxID=155126 RepID=A0AAN6GN58_9BASI|nr:hypothetical protein OC846_006725 [Tilletia horrida]KAK0558863.1 hypothetical protein OC861_006809 [Tilletia horrida]